MEEGGSGYTSCGFQGGGGGGGLLYSNFVKRGSSEIWIMDGNVSSPPPPPARHLNNKRSLRVCQLISLCSLSLPLNVT